MADAKELGGDGQKASDLFIEIWGERGQHARAAVGVASLANEAPVETEVILQIRD